VPEALARVTELLWRRALEEARAGLKLLREPDHKPGALEEMQEQLAKLSIALAEMRAREGEHLSQLSVLSKERSDLRAQMGSLLAQLKASQEIQRHQAESLERFADRFGLLRASFKTRRRKTRRKASDPKLTKVKAKRTFRSARRRRRRQ
jgi:uncharacterized protein involved in exopolysaccharide biosynthesis